jgi:serine/threonine protein phosphatase PrpC
LKHLFAPRAGAAKARFEVASRVEGHRAVLEDRAEVLEIADGLVLVVADGAGGRSGGADAAEGLVRLVREAVAAGRAPKDARRWSAFLASADDALVDDPEAGETTAVVATVTARGVVGASVGDSGLWLVGEEGWLDLTQGQPGKPFLGTGAARPVPFAARFPLGTLLAATDGLLKYAGPEQIAALARGADLNGAARELVDLVRLRSGALQDDVAVVLCRSVTPVENPGNAGRSL